VVQTAFDVRVVTLVLRKELALSQELVKLGDVELQARLKNLPNWEIDNGMLQRRFTLPSFPATMFFACAIAHVAEVGQHHPDMNISYNKIAVRFVTHSVGGITTKDFEMAQKVDELWNTFDWKPG
jgi:4a-hydroxytetrahydrobiopterin dehydratase